MKKIYQLGFIASLVALLPTGILFAGNGDGDGKGNKNTVSISNTTQAQTLTLTVLSSKPIVLTDVGINTKTDWSYIHAVNPIMGGVEVVINVDHEAQLNGEGDVIIIEIVGVDNITGVNTTDGNSGNSMPTNLVNDHNNNVASTNDISNEQADLNHQESTSNINDLPTTNPVVIFNGHKDDISIYPNPVRSETNVVTVGEILGKSIEIIDLSGHTVMNMIIPANTRQTVLDLSALNPGLYILSYKTEDGRVISKRIQKI
jgi:hypothetical protein